MAGLDVAGSAVGIASLGIQVCQGLLTYYDGWKSYNTDINDAYDAITSLSKTLALLKASTIDQRALDKARAERAGKCLQSCEDGLTKLSTKLGELRKYPTPMGLRERIAQKAQRLWYPFRKETLMDIRENVESVHAHLSLAIQSLQLDATADISEALEQLSLKHDADRVSQMHTWLSPPDPWTNHDTALYLHKAQTGQWLLQCSQYRNWATGATKHLWLSGKAGCGKTVLCCTVIEDVQSRCLTVPKTGLAFFYFTFSDDRKRQYQDLLMSLVAQLGLKEPGLPVLSGAYQKSPGNKPRTEELENIFLSIVDLYDRVYILLDALDESPEQEKVRRFLLERVEALARRTATIRIFATSRNELDIRDSMISLQADEIAVDEQAIDADIQLFVSQEIAKDGKLSRLPATTILQIEQHISHHAEGMFRWAALVLQQIQELKGLKPKYITKALQTLPKTLDATYERMLSNIERDGYFGEALALLRWLAYAPSPPTLAQLAEASIIDPAGKDPVDIDNRGPLEDALNILGGLVVVAVESKDHIEDDKNDYEDAKFRRQDQQLGADTRVRLAHFSVKEYLESERVLESVARDFYLEPGAGHHFIAQSCLTYLHYYSRSGDKQSEREDLRAFPLLEYAAEKWFYHSSLQQPTETLLELALLSSEKYLRDWLLVHDPLSTCTPFHELNLDCILPGLYYACFFGLEAVVKAMIVPGQTAKETISMAMVCASGAGRSAIVGLLLANDPDVDYVLQDSHSYWDLTALQQAAASGHVNIVKLLLRHGADFDLVAGGQTALGIASREGHVEVVGLLLRYGAEVDLVANGATALHCAVVRRHIEAVKLLVESGANIDSVDSRQQTPLQRAAAHGHVGIAKFLLDKGANVHHRNDDDETSLHLAAGKGYEDIVELLLEKKADIDSLGGDRGTALSMAAGRGAIKVLRLLLDRGASIDMISGEYGLTALQVALYFREEEAATLLRGRGARLPEST